MNRFYIATFFVCAITALHASEEKSVVPAALPGWYPLYSELKKDYQNYLNNRLEEYKKADVNMDELVAMGTQMTGGDRKHRIYQSQDEKGNRFIHVAIQKHDLPTIEWLYDHSPYASCAVCANNNKQTPLDLCLQLLQTYSFATQKNSRPYTSLCLSLKYIARTSGDAYKAVCLEKIASLQLTHKKNGSDFSFEPEIIDSLIPSKEAAQKESFLSTIYQQVCDETDGDTFTHAFVKFESPDELFAWIQQGRVSFEKNSEQLTPVDIALAKFREFTQNFMLIDQNKSSFENRRCCLFMLLNYLKIKTGTVLAASFDNCCDKHTITQGTVQ